LRIALLSDESLPLGTRVHAKMIHELALEFKKNNHTPIVITPGRPDQSTALVIDFVYGVEYWRFKSGYTRGVGMLRRLINEFLLSFRAWHALASKVKKDPFELCICYCPTIFFAPLSSKLKARGAYVYLVQRDMFPQWAVDRGLLHKRSPLLLFLRYYEKLNYQIADWIGVQSEKNKIIFSDRFPHLSNVSVLMNWSAISPPVEKYQSDDIRVRLNLVDKVVFFYGGNTGYAQDMTNIMRLARNLRSYVKGHILIVGQGDEYKLINDLVVEWKLDNVTILPSVSQSEFLNFLGAVDVGLFSLSKEHTAHNFPGKILGYMNASLPILGSVNPGNDLLPLVNEAGAGCVYINGEDILLAEAALKLLESETLRMKLGTRANSLLVDQFSVESALIGIMSKVNGEI
jgi:O26-antigen biosynthesis N-acetyl-L-fucosamine transferase